MATQTDLSFEGVDLSDLDLSDLPGVLCDPRALQEAVASVLDNALKFVHAPQDEKDGERQPQVTVAIMGFRANETARTDNAIITHVDILVHDNGPGFADDEHELVFESGYRGAASRQRASTSNPEVVLDGSGLGLPDARNLMRRMNGDVFVTRHETLPKLHLSTGSTFVVIRIPRA